MMAAAVQKNGMKLLPNTKGLIVHNVEGITNLSTYTLVNECNGGYTSSSANLTNNGSSTNGNQQNGDQQNGVQQQQQNHNDLNNFDRNNDSFNNDSEVTELQEGPASDEPEIDITINNVVCSFSVRCHLNLRDIAKGGLNVEYRRENGMITMKLRRPYSTASIWSSGKVTCTGATSEDQARVAARRFARLIQKLGYNVKFNNYRVVNVLGTCSMPFAIKIGPFSENHREAEYEPELHPGVTYKIKDPKATLKIFSTGSVTVTAPSVLDVQRAIEYIYPLIFEFKKERSAEEIAQFHALKRRRLGYSNPEYKAPMPSMSEVITLVDEEENDSETEW